MKGRTVINLKRLQLVALLLIFVFESTLGQPPTKPIPIRDEFAFRAVPWCINGLDEPEFQKYPLTEFKPFLDRDFKFVRGNDGFKYEINLYKISIEGQKLGDTEYLENTAHFQFKAERRRDYNISVITDFEETILEGLIVQAVFAPLGVGLPTGTFIEQEDINCFDCQYPLGQIVGCKKKTWLNFMHPTVLVYHHRMKTPEIERKRRGEFCEDLRFRKYCGGKSSTTVAGMQVMAAECFRDASCTAPEKCMRPQPEYICYQATRPPTPIEPPMFCQETINDKNIKKEELCNVGELKDPIDICMERNGDPKEGIDCADATTYYGRSSEVHGNLVWFTHPCQYTRRIRFIYLAVHSFSKGLYSILKSGEFDLPGVRNSVQNTKIPSPIFTGFRHNCEPSTSKNRGLPMSDKTAEKIVSPVDADLDEFDFSLTYDTCIRTQGDGIQDPKCMYTASFDNLPHFAPTVASRVFVPPQRCYSGQNQADNRILDHSSREVAECENKCKEYLTTTIATTIKPINPLIKRSFHGGINFVTNFCIMPITIFIARFYKETFNLTTIKGGKPWYWMHLAGSGGSSILMYIGYFHENYIIDTNPHVIFGNTYIIFLAVAYISSWIRHKNTTLTSVVEIVHGASGYCCFFLALCCMHTAPDLSIYPIIFVYCSCFTLGLFYVGMTCHICILDKKFGMVPRRRHFPTVESRFDELPVPKSKARRLFLIMLLVTVLPMTLGTIFY